MNRPARVLATMILAIVLTSGGCHPMGPREAQFATMGTYATVTVAADEGDRLAEYTELCRSIMEGINQQLSLYRPDSELCRLNANAGNGPMPVGEHLRSNLLLAVKYGDLSGGAFDVTVGPLVKLWGFSGGTHPAHSLPAERVVEARQRIGYGKIHVEGNAVRLDEAGMVVDLGGIAKGYAVDVCCAALQRRGARNFMVNLGGNLRVFGRPDPSRHWRIGVRHPFLRGDVIGNLDLPDGLATATSGNYEQYVEIDGRRYTHIIDPRTGLPVEGMAGVTVVATSAVEADALSTALFVMGVDAGARLTSSLPQCGALLMPDRQPLEVWVTPGMPVTFVPLPGVTPCVAAPAP